MAKVNVAVKAANAEEQLALVAKIIATDKRAIAQYPVVKLSGLRVQLCPTPASLGRPIHLLPDED